MYTCYAVGTSSRTSRNILHASKKYPTFNEEITSILNWPLMPTEFEAAWSELVQKYILQDDPMMIQLCSGRKNVDIDILQEHFCARMTSTQRSESMNHVLKKGFAKGTQNLHKFPRRVNACIQTRQQRKNEQTMASMVLKPTHPIPRTQSSLLDFSLFSLLSLS